MYRLKDAILSLLFFMVYLTIIIPIGIIFKLFNIDPMRKEVDNQKPTYWDAWVKKRFFRKKTAPPRGDGTKDPTNYPFW